MKKLLLWAIGIAVWGWVLVTLHGCASVQPACLVIHAADAVCNVIAVPLPDGGVEAVPVSGAELRAFATERKAARARADGGAP